MDFINYKGKELPIRVSYYALKQYQKETGKDISSLDDNIENLEILLYHAIVAGHKAEDKECTINRDDIELILDESMTQFNQIILNSFPGFQPADATKKK